MFACCSKGTRPGDPLADIIFNLGMTFILSELDKCREEPPSVRWEPTRGPFWVSPGNPNMVSCPQVSYVDDLALFISHESPGQLCDRVVDITDRLTEIMASFGLELNMKAWKTECILNLRGRGTTQTCERREADQPSHKVRKLAHRPKLLSSWHHPDEDCLHHTRDCEEVQGHAWGISSHCAQGLCLKGGQPQHQAAISACSVGWHSLLWSCHVARIE